MILVVDDDDFILQFVREILQQEGYEVQTATNGEEAYRILKNPKCKGMLLDMIMPGINGAGLLLLMASENIDKPVIVMAGSPDFSEAEVKQFGHVKKLIHKPFYTEDLLTLVRKYMPKEKKT